MPVNLFGSHGMVTVILPQKTKAPLNTRDDCKRGHGIPQYTPSYLLRQACRHVMFALLHLTTLLLQVHCECAVSELDREEILHTNVKGVVWQRPGLEVLGSESRVHYTHIYQVTKVELNRPCS
jgi:hypothetical protein